MHRLFPPNFSLSLLLYCGGFVDLVSSSVTVWRNVFLLDLSVCCLLLSSSLFSYPIPPHPSDHIYFFIVTFRSIPVIVSSGPGLGLATAKAIVVEVFSVCSRSQHCIAVRSLAPPPTISSLQWGRLIQKASDGLPTNVYLLTSGSLKRK